MSIFDTNRFTSKVNNNQRIPFVTRESRFVNEISILQIKIPICKRNSLIFIPTSACYKMFSNKFTYTNLRSILSKNFCIRRIHPCLSVILLSLFLIALYRFICSFLRILDFKMISSAAAGLHPDFFSAIKTERFI